MGIMDIEDRLDTEYLVSDVASSLSVNNDPDYGNKTILKEVSKYLTEQVLLLNRVSSLHLEKDYPLSLEQQVAVNQSVVSIIMPIKEVIDSKIKDISEEV